MPGEETESLPVQKAILKITGKEVRTHGDMVQNRDFTSLIEKKDFFSILNKTKPL